MNDLRIDLKVRNAIILNAMKDQGFSSILSFWKFYRTPSICDITNLINFKASPKTKEQKWRFVATKLSEILGIDEETLFPERLYKKVLPTNKLAFEVESTKYLLPTTQPSPYELIDKQEIDQEISTSLVKSMQSLSQYEQKIIKTIYGIDRKKPNSPSCIAHSLKISPQAVLSTHKIALTKMRKYLKPKLQDIL